ncbi:hypothetical protein QQ045_017496 [Rhodiola kirilowii]
MKLKLIVNNESTKVVFAEADKEFVDFLLSLLSLPLGTVTLLLKQNDGMVGSLGMLYNSIESLRESYIQPDLSKEAVLCPKVAIPLAVKHAPLLKCERVVYAQKKLYKCPRCRPPKLSDNPQTKCPSCTSAMSGELAFLNPAATADYDDSKLYMCGYCYSNYITVIPTECPTSFCRKLMNTMVTFLYPLSVPTEMGGYVKGMVSYMVMDDLVVKPMSSTISIVSLLSTFNIKDVGDLKEMTVSIGMAEGLQLLRASLFSKTVLTDVFLSQTEVKEEVVDTSAQPPVAA